METTVVHCKKSPYDIYIGRPSKWGNPFSIGKDGSREDVISKFEIYMMSPEQAQLRQDLKELQGKVLGCWCKPKPCHGDILTIMADDELWLK